MQFDIYCLNRAAKLHWIHFADEHVVFDETSGQTHLVEPVRALVINFLMESSYSLMSLSEKLTAITGFITDSMNEDIALILKELQTSGLVEVVSSEFE